ncbi:MAG: putative toxin-antitoxin system toxin component, PIN family [Phormidesmis sp.]
MTVPQIVIDTNVIVAGLRSDKGAAFLLLERIGTESFDMHLSVPLVIEYQDVLSRSSSAVMLTPDQIENLLDFYCSVSNQHLIFFLWRPFLVDSKDDMVLELAVKAGCDYIITYNARDFKGIEKFGIKIMTPGDFLKLIGVL